MPTVLVTNGILRKALATTRSLGRTGWDVIVGECTFPNPAAWSKLACRGVRYPNPSEHPTEFRGWLEKYLTDEGIDVFLPLDDDVMDIAVHEQETLCRMVRLLVPSLESYTILRDKRQAISVARSVGMSVPSTWWPQTEEDVRNMADDFVYPMVVRARNGSGSRGIAIAESAEELMGAYRHISKHYDKPMLQQFIQPGARIDVALLFDEQTRLCASFTQRELRHFPMPRGPSTAAESARMEVLERMSISMAKRLKWRGIVEFEFMQDGETGRWMFMEANPRMWNSLQLSIRCGVDFPSIYAALCMGDAEVKPPADYPLCVRSRFLWPGDILYFLSQRNWLHFGAWTGTRQCRREKDDVWEMKDPFPLLGLLILFSLSIFKVKMWKLLLDR